MQCLKVGDLDVRVLVVEDVGTVAAMMEAALRSAGMEVVCVPSGATALAARGLFSPDVVLIDLALPDTDGMSLVRPFSEAGCGVIVVTATSEEASRVSALDIGADDYMVKPVMPRELAARVRAVHRRLNGRSGATPQVRITVDVTHRELIGLNGAACALTEAEMLAFDALIDAAGAPVSRDWVGRVALKRPLHPEDRSVDQLVLKLRRKLSALGCPERVILSVRRQGYVLADPGLFQRLGDDRPA